MSKQLSLSAINSINNSAIIGAICWHWCNTFGLNGTVKLIKANGSLQPYICTIVPSVSPADRVFLGGNQEVKRHVAGYFLW